MNKGARVGVLIASVVLIVAAIALAWVFQAGGLFGGSGDGYARDGDGKQLTVVRGLVGSEKAPLFQDQAVVAAFEAAGLSLQIDTAGSRSMLAADPASYDFYFPSSAPVADELVGKVPGAKATQAFQTPLVINTFTDVHTVLEANGLAHTDAAGTPTFDVAAYLAALDKDTRWNQLKSNTAYPSSRTITVTTTDPLRSNSGLMFTALTAYVANGNKVVSSAAQVKAVAPRIRPAFVDQGYKQASSEGPFEDYLALGKQRTPLVLAYESQLLSRQLAASPAVTDQMVTLYPEPGMFSQHVVVARTEGGGTVARMLTQDPALTAAVARHGFHPQTDPGAFTTAVTQAGVQAPPSVTGAVEPPDYAVLDLLAKAVSPDPAAPAEAPVPSAPTSTTAKE